MGIFDKIKNFRDKVTEKIKNDKDIQDINNLIKENETLKTIKNNEKIDAIKSTSEELVNKIKNFRDKEEKITLNKKLNSENIVIFAKYSYEEKQEEILNLIRHDLNPNLILGTLRTSERNGMKENFINNTTNMLSRKINTIKSQKSDNYIEECLNLNFSIEDIKEEIKIMLNSKDEEIMAKFKDLIEKVKEINEKNLKNVNKKSELLSQLFNFIKDDAPINSFKSLKENNDKSKILTDKFYDKPFDIPSEIKRFDETMKKYSKNKSFEFK